MALVILIGIILSPIILIEIFKVNSVVAYLTLCLGAVVSEFVDNNPILKHFLKSSNYINHISYINNLKLLLLLVPLVLVIILMIRTAKGGLFSFNLIGSICVGVLLAYLLVPILPHTLNSGILDNKYWLELNNQKSNVIAVSSFIILIMLVLQRSKFSHKGGSALKHKK